MRRAARAVAAALLWLLPAASHGGEIQFQVEFDWLNYPGWNARGGRVVFIPRDNAKPSVSLFAKEVHLSPDLVLGDFQFHCPEADIRASLRACAAGAIAFRHPIIGETQGRVSVRYFPEREAARITLREMRLASGVAQVSGRWEGKSQDWGLKLAVHSLDVAKLSELVRRLSGEGEPPTDLKGRLDAWVELSGKGSGITVARLAAKGRRISFNGIQAAQDASGVINVTARRARDTWNISGNAALNGGALYLEPGISLAGVPPGFALTAPTSGSVKLRAEAQWQMADQSLQVQSIRLHHPEVMDLAIAGFFHPNRPKVIETLDLNARVENLAEAFAPYLQPLLLGYGLGELDTAGAFRLSARVEQGRLRAAHLRTNNVSARDGQGRFRFTGLKGSLAFNTGVEAVPSRLRWRKQRSIACHSARGICDSLPAKGIST